MAHGKELVLLTLLAGYSFVSALPFPSNDNQAETSTAMKLLLDNPVQQLEKLKATETKSTDKGEGHSSVRVEMHRLDEEVKQNGEVISRVTEQGESSSVDGQPPHYRVQTELEVPNEGVHKVIVQDGTKVTVHDHQDAHKEKVFRGAARLVQPSSVAADTPPAPAPAAPASAPAHTATNNGNRRSFNADISKEMNNNMDHYSSYSGVQYSPLDMAEYVFWTGDERGVTTAIEEFLQEGLMTKNEAIAFLQEVKFNIEYLTAHYAQQSKVAEVNAQQERIRNLLMDQAAQKDMHLQMQHRPLLQSFPFGGSGDVIKAIRNKNYEFSNSVIPALPSLPFSSDFRSDTVKRSANDPMLSTNIINTSDYDRESGPLVTEEEYEEMMDKLRGTDALYTQNSLAEIIYQLAKMMFVQTLSRDPAESRYAMQRFMNFLETEAERGQLSRNIEKTVLDVMISALSDTVAEHPDMVQPREGYGPTIPNRFFNPMLETAVPESHLSRALLAAYKDELAKGHLMQKIKEYSN